MEENRNSDLEWLYFCAMPQISSNMDLDFHGFSNMGPSCPTGISRVGPARKRSLAISCQPCSLTLAGVILFLRYY